MTTPSLTISGVGKAFRRYRGEWRRVLSWLGLPMAPAEEHWVLRNISFRIMPGEAVGIVGQNGAGKSTLLKLITGTLRPTKGEIAVNGRIAALLELGMGFNPEFSGRRNVYHTAGLMGFQTEQVDAVIDEIEAFAEIGAYFDQPVRIYSSGMQVRVAFAVATAFRPDILIVDEALSVGDTYFQHKSFDRIRSFRDQGTTLLIVSHDKVAIQSLCSRAILLSNGGIARDGEPEAVFDYYNALIAEREEGAAGGIEQARLGDNRIQTTSGTGEARITKIALYGADGAAAEVVGVGESLRLVIEAAVYREIPSLVFGYSIKDRLGQVIFGTNTWHTNQTIIAPRPGDRFQTTVTFPADFGVGSYSVQAALVDRDTHLTANYEWRDLALVFEVVNPDKPQFVGCAWQQPAITIVQEPAP